MPAFPPSSSHSVTPVKEEEAYTMEKLGFKLADGTLNGAPVYNVTPISCAACTSQGRPCLARAVKPGSTPGRFRTTQCRNCWQGNGEGSCSMATYRGALEWKWDEEARVFLKVDKAGKAGKPDIPNGARSVGTAVKVEPVDDANPATSAVGNAAASGSGAKDEMSHGAPSAGQRNTAAPRPSKRVRVNSSGASGSNAAVLKVKDNAAAEPVSPPAGTSSLAITPNHQREGVSQTGSKRKRADNQEDDALVRTRTPRRSLAPPVASTSAARAAAEKEKLEADLTIANNKITTLKAEVAEYTTTIVMLQDAFDFSETKMDSLKTELETRNGEIQRLQSDLKGQATQIKVLEAELEHQKDMITWLDADEVAYNCVIEKGREDLKEGNAIIAQLESDLAKCQAQMETRAQQYSSEINKLESDKRILDATVKAFKANLAERDAETRRLESEFARRLVEIEKRYSEKIGSLQLELSRLNWDLTGRAHEVTKLNTAINDRDLKIKKLEEGVAYLGAQLAAMRRGGNASNAETDAKPQVKAAKNEPAPY